MKELLGLAKKSVRSASIFLESFVSSNPVLLLGTSHNGKEIQLNLDLELDNHIRKSLASTGIPVLSEERPPDVTLQNQELTWILDPLDGTTNFYRSAGPSAISLALWKVNTPIFGIVYRIDTQELFVGGKDFGTQCDGKPVHVSDRLGRDGSILATGLPSRNLASSKSQLLEHQALLERVTKVRMLGSAAVSLALTSKGSIDIYSENGIMLWDIAGGLALVEGAGGRFTLLMDDNFACSVRAAHPQYFGQQGSLQTGLDIS